MKISEALKIIKRQMILGKTPKGRPMTDIAKSTMDAVVEDQKNYHNDVIQCLGCGYVTSILLTSDGCPNCGILDMTTEIDG